MRVYEIMKYIDKYRLENKMPIYQLTKGIMSTRNYSRLLSGESALSFEDYSALMKRLHAPLFEFSLYVFNCNFFEYIHESNFQQAVDDQKYEEAYEIIKPYLNEQKWGSIFAEKTLPIALKYVTYQLNKCTHAELLAYSKKIIHFDHILQSTLINLDDFEALLLYTKFCSFEEKKAVSSFLNRIILIEDVKILNASVEHTTSRLHRHAIQLLTSFDDNDESAFSDLVKIATIALEYQSRAKIYGEDQFILKLLYTYYKKHHIASKHLLIEFVLSALGSNEESTQNELKNLLSPEEVHEVLDLIKKQDLKKTNLWDGGLI